MSNSQKQAVITLIEKKDIDRTFLENWRPISLINVDSKIASKVITMRIIKVLPEIIRCNQNWLCTKQVHRRSSQINYRYNGSHKKYKYGWNAAIY